MTPIAQAYRQLCQQLRAADPTGRVELLAVSKTRSSEEIRALAGLGQRAFGENYVQEALGKQALLSDQALTWHLIGPLQSNKCKEVAQHFDWVDAVDRLKLVSLLEQHRPPGRAALNVLIQVNIDDEQSKAGCQPQQIAALAAAIDAAKHLRLRGLMAIPAPGDRDRLGRAFAAMKALFDSLRTQYPSVDTLSMGMSDDFELAIAHGATQVRVGSALFGPRPAKPTTAGVAAAS